MTARKLISLCILGVTLTAGLAEAGKLRFTYVGYDSVWTNETNWINEKKPEEGGFPGEMDIARLINGVTLKITNEVVVGEVHLASTGSATLIIDGGSLVTTSPTGYNSACYTSGGSIIVKNGGSAVFKGRFFVGYPDAPNGSLVIHDGTVRAVNLYFHNIDYTGTETLDTRTTINSGGLLDVNELILNAGVMDIAGGTLIIRQHAVYLADQWIADGRMIAMGGKAGWKINATFDEATGWTTLVAEPVTEPSALEKPNPVTPVPSAPQLELND